MIAGTYVAYYGIYELRVFAGADSDDPVVDGARVIQEWLATRVESISPVPALVGAAIITCLVAGFVVMIRRRGLHETEQGDENT
jgi:hypothetical protein